MSASGTLFSARSTSVRASFLGLSASLVLGIGAAHAQSAVVQRGYDQWLTGANLAETTLTPANVAAGNFGKIFSDAVDDSIFAQPLYVPSVAIAGQGTHNVVYAATMSDTLYAFDAENGDELWSVNLSSLVGGTPVPIAQYVFSNNKNIVGNLGILSTPVTDLSTHLMYVVSCTLESNTIVYRLWAIDITSGARPKGTGVVIEGSYTGISGAPSTFEARYQTQRVSLTMFGNNVILAFGALELEYAGGYVGWVMQYDKSTLAQSGVFATVTTGNRGGGVWQSGRPPAVDSTGHAYVYTGNAYGSGYDGINNFSESALRLDTTQHLKLIDWFTPENWGSLDSADLDLSSSGPLLMPGTSPGLLAGGGKGSTFYLLNTRAMGHYSETDSGVVQEFNMPKQFRGGPVYWQRSAAQGGPLLFNWGSGDVVRSFAFDGTKFGETAATQGNLTMAYPGGILTLSASGQRHGTGVIWATVATSGDAMNDPPVPGALYAFNAENLSEELWNSTTDASRDSMGNFGKLVPPLVANGRVYVATWSNQMVAYGLLSAYSALPAQVTFGYRPLNHQSAAQLVTVTNTGGIPLVFKGITVSSTGTDYFAETNNCPKSLDVGAACTIRVTFDPTTTTPSTAQLIIRTANAAGTQTIPLSGTGAKS
jgi:outer membrane protein assembly factor BamB